MDRKSGTVRVTLASTLGRHIDGAWWPRSAAIGRELPQLVSLLGARLGEIVDIEVGWSASQAPPRLDVPGWEGMHQHVLTIIGRDASANLLIVPHRTGTALAVMVLRVAAGLPISPSHLDTHACRTANAVVHAARIQRELHRGRLANCPADASSSTPNVTGR
ncbi:hypothetical protein BST27_27630 [Mycobacterium intermedium]|uniref:Uncharacterized protein n=1 Tax=Mycobacterium intermedium TaxID=28445 RepID=A0A1E3S0M5_MYCIE|nr:hypothetical protein BHQ20_29345 [Mycobacterium intermedium]OPE47933.1 hypothetical protein BV508_20225 [Mycobacterium intermedium]ORA94788.1 hypothetical protein BST27_27630 [Mycobacterium intermedium]